MKFIIRLKNNNLEIDTSICRALLLLSFLVTFLYKNEANNIINLAIGLVLMLAVLFTKYLLCQLSIKKIVLLTIAAILLFVATYSSTFSLLLLLIGMLSDLLHKTPIITIDATEVRINKILSNKGYNWEEFSNVILKDNLLTIDFANNTILQLEIENSGETINEAELNTFCKACLYQ
jgi:hypothetical protein